MVWKKIKQLKTAFFNRLIFLTIDANTDNIGIGGSNGNN